jgi:hypothetical protein
MSECVPQGRGGRRHHRQIFTDFHSREPPSGVGLELDASTQSRNPLRLFPEPLFQVGREALPLHTRQHAHVDWEFGVTGKDAEIDASRDLDPRVDRRSPRLAENVPGCSVGTLCEVDQQPRHVCGGIHHGLAVAEARMPLVAEIP